MKLLKETSTKEIKKYLDFASRYTPMGWEYQSEKQRRETAKHEKKVAKFKRELKRRETKANLE